MEIRVVHTTPAATAEMIPDFPMIRLDTDLVVYQEALINGQYLLVNASAMGRPKSREWIWNSFSEGASSVRPLRTRQHAFQIEIEGQLLVDHWEWISAEQKDAARAGCRQLVVKLRHSERPVEIEVHTLVDDTPFLTRWLVIKNISDRCLAVSRVFPWSGQPWEPVGRGWHTIEELRTLPGAIFSLGRFAETDAGAEGSFEWMTLPRGRYGFETLHGRSGWGTPCFVVRNEVTGEMMMSQFAWSGNWQVQLFNDYEAARRPPRDARLYAQVGMAGPAPLRVLEAGESARTPAVHVGFLFGDLDRCIQALHTHERLSVILPQPEKTAHLVEVNHTGYTRNAQITESQLHEEIDVAADVGVELFMLDAGWFGGVSESWSQTVGDWEVESPLLPHGVKGIVDYAHEKGLLFGLWVEAERMGPTSLLLKNHPDWAMTKRGEHMPNLDLSKPEVATYLERTLVGLVEKYELDCFRLDYNISVGEGGEAARGGYTENVLWRHYDAFYRIFDRIHERFPHLLLENCSSGGGRTDLGIMSRFHWTQVTDRWSPGPQLKIMNGMTMALPPELCEPLLGAISDGVADIDFMLRIGMFSHFAASGIFPNMDERHSLAREHWRHAIQLYKTFVRPIIANCRMFHHTPVQSQMEAGEWVVLECMSQDATQGYAGVFRLGGAKGHAYQLFPKGLDLSKQYQVTYDTTGASREMEAGKLADQGLRVAVSGAMTSELILFEAI